MKRNTHKTKPAKTTNFPCSQNTSPLPVYAIIPWKYNPLTLPSTF